ncbi:B12-binding domain-containing radical SAM protein [Elusimicrobiota bacterium]
MKIVLCYPSLLPGQKPRYGLQPLGILYMASVLKENGIDAEIIDAEIEGLTVKEMAEELLACEPALIGFSIMTPQLIPALETAALLKKEKPELQIVLGGAHINATMEDTLNLSECFDCAVYGEGEATLLEVARNVRKKEDNPFKNVLGIIYRDKNGKIITNPPRPMLMELDALPRIDYSMVDLKKYSIPTLGRGNVISMTFSRGCSYQCTYCSVHLNMGNRVRFFSVERAVREIDYNYKKFKIKNFAFRDSNFTINREWTLQFCQALIKAGLKINWRCNTRVDKVDEELLETMKQAGCYIIYYGAESGDPNILKKLQKGHHVDQIYTAHKMTKKAGIRTTALLMLGNYGETPPRV